MQSTHHSILRRYELCCEPTHTHPGGRGIPDEAELAQRVSASPPAVRQRYLRAGAGPQPRRAQRRVRAGLRLRVQTLTRLADGGYLLSPAEDTYGGYLLSQAQNDSEYRLSHDWRTEDTYCHRHRMTQSTDSHTTGGRRILTVTGTE